MAFSFETLTVWQKSRVLVKEIYEITADFPDNEKYGLTSQLRRAAVSIASNLAEGSGRIAIKEKIHFTEIAYGSLSEVLCQLILAEDLGLACPNTAMVLRPFIEEIGRLINAYHTSLVRKMESLG